MNKLQLTKLPVPDPHKLFTQVIEVKEVSIDIESIHAETEEKEEELRKQVTDADAVCVRVVEFLLDCYSTLAHIEQNVLEKSITVLEGCLKTRNLSLPCPGTTHKWKSDETAGDLSGHEWCRLAGAQRNEGPWRICNWFETDERTKRLLVTPHTLSRYERSSPTDCRGSGMLRFSRRDHGSVP